jgi:hypothetical protein
MEVSGQLHGPAALPPRERAPDTHWLRDWVGPGGRAGEEKNSQFLPGIEPLITQSVAQRYTTELQGRLKKTLPPLAGNRNPVIHPVG